MTVKLGLVLITLAVACSCAQGTSERGTPTPTLQSAGSVQVAPNPWGPLAVIDPEGPFPLGAALATGTIRITDDCVVLDEGAREVLLVWIADRTTWNAADRSVSFRNLDGSAVTADDGDRVELGGAGESVEENGALHELDWLRPPSPTCAHAERFTVSGVDVVR
jgi:hypothetical protein